MSVDTPVFRELYDEAKVLEELEVKLNERLLVETGQDALWTSLVLNVIYTNVERQQVLFAYTNICNAANDPSNSIKTRSEIREIVKESVIGLAIHSEGSNTLLKTYESATTSDLLKQDIRILQSAISRQTDWCEGYAQHLATNRSREHGNNG
ncbi:hypothetical protein [Rhodopirellula halodulae]|uniref:hypothetical protein n=1 Tax=Rhodopirellula halodulae TaxID=2894198 RepID=UPI001E654DD7|nr:hypothetical protein [Rhodopirellula sp. JC737]MCC9656756.1 hypothetical protein [Rhodopirellula sp. JC737]